MTHTTTMGWTPINLELARELTAHLLTEMHHLYRENEHIEKLLNAGDEYELILLPGESLDDIVNNLKMVQTLASEPAPMPTTGRDRERHHYGATHQRDGIRLFATVALALLDPNATGHARSDSDETPDVLHAAESAPMVYQLGSTS
jgi:hypothetical protein